MHVSWRPLSSGIVLPVVARAAETGRRIAWCDGNAVVATLAMGRRRDKCGTGQMHLSFPRRITFQGNSRTSREEIRVTVNG